MNLIHKYNSISLANVHTLRGIIVQTRLIASIDTDVARNVSTQKTF